MVHPELDVLQLVELPQPEDELDVDDPLEFDELPHDEDEEDEPDPHHELGEVPPEDDVDEVFVPHELHHDEPELLDGLHHDEELLLTTEVPYSGSYMTTVGSLLGLLSINHSPFGVSEESLPASDISVVGHQALSALTIAVFST